MFDVNKQFYISVPS